MTACMTTNFDSVLSVRSYVIICIIVVYSNQPPATVALIVNAVASDLVTLLWLRVRQYILERRPNVVSLSHSHVPTKPHESSLCGESGWLLSCDYSLTHRSQTPSHSSTLTPSFRLNHRADLLTDCDLTMKV